MTDDLQKLLDVISPTPWRMSALETCSILDRNRDRLATANWLHLWGRRTATEVEANARLIALAPTLAARVISAEKVVADIADCAKDRAADAPEWNDSETVQITVSISTLRHALAAYDSLTTPSAPAPQST